MNLSLVTEAIRHAAHEAQDQADELERMILAKPPPAAANVLILAKAYMELRQKAENYGSAFDAATRAEDETRELKQKYEWSLRCRLFWRILCMRMALGDIRIEDAIQASFHELIENIPSQDALEQQLHELVERYETMQEVAGHADKPLRSIMLT